MDFWFLDIINNRNFLTKQQVCSDKTKENYNYYYYYFALNKIERRRKTKSANFILSLVEVMKTHKVLMLIWNQTLIIKQNVTMLISNDKQRLEV